MARRALGCLIVSLLILQGCGSDPEPEPAAAPTAWSVDVEGYDSGLFAVWGHDDGPLWTVGADDGKGPLLLTHAQGRAGAWARVDTSAFPGDLWWLHGPDAQTLYLVGAQGRVVRWQRSGDGGPTGAQGTWTTMPTPTKRVLYGCWAADASHIWAVGGDPKGVEAGVVLLSDGVTWTEVTALPPVPKGVSFFKVFGTSATDVRVVGVGGTVLHFDGEVWTREDLKTTQRLITLHGDGDLQVIVGGTGNGAVFERDRAASPDSRGTSGWKDVSPEAIQALNGVRLRGGKAWAVGFRGTLVDRTKTGWELRDEAPTSMDLHGVFIDKTGTGWAVGGNLFSQPASEGVILVR